MQRKQCSSTALLDLRSKNVFLSLIGGALVLTSTIYAHLFMALRGAQSEIPTVVGSSNIMLRQRKPAGHLSSQHTAATKSDTKTCHVAVINSKATHYETLESIASQLPLQYLSIHQEECANIVFDYHIYAHEERYKSWETYFYHTMQGKSYDDERQNRVVGTLTLHPSLPPNGIIDPYAFTSSNGTTKPSYDAIIEASCYCRRGSNNHVKWINQDDSNSCIFHETCPRVADHPRALWLSPHHEHYYIPSQLPAVTKSISSISTDNNNNMIPTLCVVGGTKRRNWGLLGQYLDTLPMDEISKSFRLLVLGFGPYPEQLKGKYLDITTTSSPVDYQDFHDQVARRCDAILMLVSKQSHADYFLGPHSLQKLSGVLPIVMAYRLPVVMHEELHDLYRNNLPANLPFATHSDDPSSFVSAMNAFLPQLEEWRQQKQSIVVN